MTEEQLIKEAIKDFKKIYQDDVDGKNSPREVCLGCYECGEQIDVDGICDWLSSTLKSIYKAGKRDEREKLKDKFVEISMKGKDDVDEWKGSMLYVRFLKYLKENKS